MNPLAYKTMPREELEADLIRSSDTRIADGTHPGTLVADNARAITERRIADMTMAWEALVEAKFQFDAYELRLPGEKGPGFVNCAIGKSPLTPRQKSDRRVLLNMAIAVAEAYAPPGEDPASVETKSVDPLLRGDMALVLDALSIAKAHFAIYEPSPANEAEGLKGVFAPESVELTEEEIEDRSTLLNDAISVASQHLPADPEEVRDIPAMVPPAVDAATPVPVNDRRSPVPGE